MFAIEINTDTLALIQERLHEDSVFEDQLEAFTRMTGRWYFIHGYVAPRGAFYEEAVLPGFIVETQFEYDPQKIDHDWDQIVRY